MAESDRYHDGLRAHILALDSRPRYAKVRGWALTSTCFQAIVVSQAVPTWILPSPDYYDEGVVHEKRVKVAVDVVMEGGENLRNGNLLIQFDDEDERSKRKAQEALKATPRFAITKTPIRSYRFHSGDMMVLSVERDRKTGKKKWMLGYPTSLKETVSDSLAKTIDKKMMQVITHGDACDEQR